MLDRIINRIFGKKDTPAVDANNVDEKKDTVADYCEPLEKLRIGNMGKSEAFSDYLKTISKANYEENSNQTTNLVETEMIDLPKGYKI